MGRSLTLAAAAVCYAAFFGAFVYLVGFVAGFDPLPTHVDKGLAGPTGHAVLVDLGADRAVRRAAFGDGAARASRRAGPRSCRRRSSARSSASPRRCA